MAARAGMAALITRVRGLIGDEGTSPVFSDEQIQDALDGTQRSFLFEPLGSVSEVVDGETLFRRFFSAYQNLDSDWTLYAGRTPLAPEVIVSPNERTGLFLIDEGITGGLLSLSGQAYGINDAAIALLRQWMAKIKLSSWDFSDGQGTYHRSQRLDAMNDLIMALRSQSGGSAGGRSTVGVRIAPGYH